MKRLLACLALSLSLLQATEKGEEIRLWPNGAPGSEGVTDPEVFKGEPKLPTQFTVVHYPSIYVFLPPAEKANGMAVLIEPGGGHTQLVMAKEGYDIAAWLNSQGIAAFVLKYRLARAPNSKYTIEGSALPDAARAMRLIRSRSQEWKIDQKRIGVMGFSAGGEVAGLIAARFDSGKPDAPDSIDRQSSRPDFATIVYPGPTPKEVPKDAPPTFLTCADDDRSHIKSTLNFYTLLHDAGVSAELHIYAAGGHGFGIKPSKLPEATWTERFKEWLIDRKLLTADK